MYRLILALLLGSCPVVQAQQDCDYQVWSWDSQRRQAVNLRSVSKAYSALSANEVDRYTGCSVCEQDQQLISLAPLKPFKLCRVIAPQVEALLRRLLAAGEPITAVVGYRVGQTRGPLDADGLRTEFSNHAYGIAIDINPAQNGLYEDCIQFDASCKLLRGGHWIPGHTGAITADSAIVAGFEAIGFNWGGEIAGRQKDFMHFSPSGY